MMLETEVQRAYVIFLSSKFNQWQRWALNLSLVDSKPSALNFLAVL